MLNVGDRRRWCAESEMASSRCVTAMHSYNKLLLFVLLVLRDLSWPAVIVGSIHVNSANKKRQRHIPLQHRSISWHILRIRRIE